jgi:zinc transport system substrate-binding protein
MLKPLLVTVLLIVLIIPGARAEQSDPTLVVFASVLPIRTFVERVGGERVDARVMVRPGQSPATYDPTPAQVAALAKTDLYVRVGVPFEEAWMPRIRAANPDMAILDLRDGLSLRRIEDHKHEPSDDHKHDHDHDHDHKHDHDHGHGHGHGHHHDREQDHAHRDDHDAKVDEPQPSRDIEQDQDTDAEAHAHADEMDPHVWTSPPLVRQMIARIRDRVSALDPAGADTYAANQAAFDAELAALDADLRATLADLEQRRFLVYHPAWGYFADTYGLEQIPIEREGKAPGPRRLDALIRQARETDTRVVFVQPQFDRRAAQQVARAIEGRVETADPLATDYADNLRRFARLIAGTEKREERSAQADAHADHDHAHVDQDRAHADHDHAHPGHEASTHRHEAGTHHQHGAHVHGVAMLNVALDSDELLIELTSPAMNLVGFEHAPRDAAQRDAVAEARRALAEPERLIRINPEADCTLAESHAMLELGEHAGDAHDPTQSDIPSHATEVHADGHGEYHWRCAHPGRLAHIELPLFDVFPGTERIEVQLITPTDQSASELTSDNRRLDL